MKDYLLHTLSHGDFEELIVKICHEILGIGTISFSSGADEGRDGFFDGTAQRFPSKADPWTGKFVIQAKHTERADASCSESDFARIVRDETPKVKKLRLAGECENYLLFTNRKLSAPKEKALARDLRQNTGVANVAILGKETLTSYLDGAPKIAKALWRQVSPVVTGVPQPGPEPISREQALSVWRRRILRLHSRLMPYFQERSAPLLEHVYVELQLDPERLRGATDLEAPEVRSMEWLSRRLSIRDVLKLEPARHLWITRRWLLRGDPGSGKTTLLRHLAWTLADAGGKSWVPVFESLPRLMADRLSVFGRIEEDLERADQPGSEIRRILEEEAGQGRLLLLLDGLDEVPLEARERAEDLLSELAARWPKSPIVATTRPIGAWSPGPEFLELEVLPFDAVRRRGFLRRWFGDQDRGVAVAGVVEADRSLRELASNPLYLTLLALLLQGGEEPERYRTRLFDQIFDLLEEGRHHKPPTPIANRQVAHQVLCRLAYRMTEDNRDGEAAAALERRLLEDKRLREPLMLAWPYLRRFLDDVAEKTGILGAHDGPQADWRFWHRTFREGLTAEQLAEGYESGVRVAIVEHARQIATGDLSRWAEPYALLAGRVEDADDLVRALVQENRDLGLRAVATAQGLKDETLTEVLELSEQWPERQKVYQRLPELIDDPLRALALADQLRQRTRNGNDLFFLEQAVVAVGGKWPDARRTAERLQARLYDHIPPPSEELFRWIETLDGRVGLWREIPAGEFLMGSPPDEKDGSEDERPQHQVRIRAAFRMAAVPVTIAQYAAFDPEYLWLRQGKEPDEKMVAHPAVNVTWYQAFAFCRWLSASLPWAKGARLPTEEEWEYACRAGTESRYWSGNMEADLKRVGWYFNNSDNRTHRVGRKAANPWGLYDVHGNAWEWTASERTYDYSGRESGVEVDPGALEPADLTSASGAVRVARGGCGWFLALGARSAYRNLGISATGIRGPGFRVCLPAAPERSSIGDH